MVSYKLDKYDKYFVAFVLFILVIFNISQCFASEDNVDDTKERVYFETLDNTILSLGSTSIAQNDDYDLYYLQLEKGYTYYISLNYINNSRMGYSDSLNIGSHVYDFMYFQNDGHIDITIDANTTNYLFFDYSVNLTPNYTIYREFSPGINSAINDLVENVGPQQLWSVFESGIDFIGVVVLVAFGLFLIVLLIKKLSKGKSDF